ncbi:MAG TPA: DNA topoisomerase VI subunit B [archaeon]|nr:DNA topoisomerase VI subunit B [archaeon]
MADEHIAEKMSDAMREVSVAEFFEKNRHLLGYENATKALLTVVKELLDNSLDACNEAEILPEVKITIKQINEERFKVTVEDNGPGIKEEKVPYAFGKLLYGSKFYRMRQSRGIQGLGGHGAVLYSQLTTGKPTTIISSIGGKDIHYFELMINVTKNEPHVIKHEVQKNPDKWHGLKIEMELEGRYIEGKQSIAEYIKQTHMANPYTHITFISPNGKTDYKRLVDEMPVQPKEIKPHPYGVEIGVLRRLVHATKAKNLIGFLMGDFSRVGRGTATQILKIAKLENKKPQSITHEESERLHKAMQTIKLMAPPTNCLSPLGTKILEEGLKKDSGAEFVVAVSRPPSVYRGNPFLVEVCLGYGGSLIPDSSAQVFRFANKVPLLYHQSDCVTSDAVKEVDFRRYGFSHPSNSLPIGPLAILIHFASVWVPFTSEGKQAIANYDEILKEIKLAIQDAGRRLAIYVRQKAKRKDAQMRRELFERYIPELAESLEKLTDVKREKIIEGLEKIVKKGKIKFVEEKVEENENEEGRSKEEPEETGQ